MANTNITKLNGSDIISKSYDVINQNFNTLYTEISSLTEKLEKYIKNNGTGNDFDSLYWDGDKYLLKRENGDYIAGSDVTVASAESKGLISADTQTIGGKKKYTNAIVISKGSGTEKGIRGTNGQSIITQIGNDIYIGDESGKGIQIKYNNNGVFQGIYYTGVNGISQKFDAELITGDLWDAITQIESDYNKQLADINNQLSGLENQTDGNVNNWFGDDEITNDNRKSITNDGGNNDSHFTPWTIDEYDDDANNDDNSKHVGDFYVYSKKNKSTRKAYIYTEKTNSSDKTYYEWVELDEEEYPDVLDALFSAIDAQSTADGKQTTFWGKPTPPYQKGDMWYVTDDDITNAKAGTNGLTIKYIDNTYKINLDPSNASNEEFAVSGNLLFCNNDESETFKITDWSHLLKYINTDTLNDKLEETVQELVNQNDKTITVWEIDGYDSNYITDLSEINDNNIRPWTSGTNDDHIGDILYSKASSTYFEYGKNDDGVYLWQKCSSNNMFSAINNQISNLKTTINGLEIDGNRSFIIATRTEMYEGTTSHGTGDVWVVEADESEDVDGDNPYKDFLLGGFYLCNVDSEEQHLGGDSIHTDNTDNHGWTLLTDYDNLIEAQIESNENLKKSIEQAKNAEDYITAATSDNVISITEKIQLRQEWYNISGINNIDNVGTANYLLDGNTGSFCAAYNMNETYKDNITTYQKNKTILTARFRSLAQYLKETVKLYVNEHTDLDDKKGLLEKFRNYYNGEQQIYSDISGQSITDAASALSKADEALSKADGVNPFEVVDDVVKHGNTYVTGGLQLSNLLFVNDSSTSQITGGLSGEAGDNTGLFLGCTYEEAFGAANWDNLDSTVKEYYYNLWNPDENGYVSKDTDGKPIVPVVLTKDGVSSKIGGCFFDGSTLKVPVENIYGDITCTSLKADNDTSNTDDAEATITSNSFKIQYGNAYIQIALINGVPTLIGVDSDGNMVWSLGEENNDSPMYNLIYSMPYGTIKYVEKEDAELSYSSIIFDRVGSTVNVNLPTCEIVNKYPLNLIDDKLGYKILPLRTKMTYKIGNKLKYFYFEVTQECPYYSTIENLLCGYPTYNASGTSQDEYSALYYYADNPNDLISYIQEKYGLSNTDFNETIIKNDIFGNSNEYKTSYKSSYSQSSTSIGHNVYCIINHNIVYMSYYIDYAKNCLDYIYAIFESCSWGGLIDEFGILPGESKKMNFQGDFTQISIDNGLYNYFKNYSNNSQTGKYEVNVYNQDGKWKNIILCSPQKSSSGTETSTNYILNTGNDNYDDYLTTYKSNTTDEIDEDNISKYRLAVFELQSGLPTPRNMSELCWMSWWYGLDAVRDSVANNGSYSWTFDDYYPRIFDITSEIELLDTGIGDTTSSSSSGYDYKKTITHVVKSQQYSLEYPFNVIKGNNSTSGITEYYKNLKLISFDCNGTNILNEKNTASFYYLNYRLEITDSINEYVYTIIRNEGNKKYLKNGEEIDELPEALEDFFYATYGIKYGYKLVEKSGVNKDNISIETSSEYEDICFVKFTNSDENTTGTEDKITITFTIKSNDISGSTTVFDESAICELSKTITVTRLYKGEKITAYQSPELNNQNPELS